MKYRLGKNKSSSVLFGSLLAILAIIVAICSVMVRQSNRIISEETELSLLEVSEQTSITINQQIQSNLTMLDDISSDLTMLENSPELRNSYLNNINSELPFEWIGVTDAYGLLTLEGLGSLDLSSCDAVQDALHGNASINEQLVSSFDGRKGILYAGPDIQNDAIIGAVVGWISPDAMQSPLLNDIFEGEGFFHIINQNGDFIIRSTNKNAKITDDNFFDAMERDGTFYGNASLQSTKKNISEGKHGYLHFSLSKNVEEVMEYNPLEEGGWYLLSIVPMDIYSQKINQLTTLMIVLSAVIVVMFLALLTGLVYTNGKNLRRIQKLAYEDPVTGGFTSQRFELAVRECLEQFTPFAWVALDIHRFKLINDTFGSQRGDQVLKLVHDSIKKCLNPGEYVSRTSSDRFNLILSTVNKRHIEERIRQISQEINRFNEHTNTPYYLTIDCGVYLVGSPDIDIVIIRDRANTARKSNKQLEGPSRCVCTFYNDYDRLRMRQDAEMENAQERALKNREFEVYLQPKIDLASGKMAGAEALSRWNFSGEKMLSPAVYIPLFERNGFIHELDLYVFEEVCSMIRKWIDEGISPVPISVNLSRSQLHIPHFLRQFQKIRKHYNIPPELIEFELTETVVFENLSLLKKIIQDIHRAGFLCSMDDFGSGYSSLNVLREVPVDMLKLDRDFFLNQNDARGNQIIETVIQLAKKLGMLTVAEGIETMEQVNLLKQMGCDMIQGYVFSKPVPVKEFEEQLLKTL